MNKKDIKEFLDEKVIEYNTPAYIDSDPIQIPHTFSQKENIEIASFLTATIAWGNRKSIIKNGFKLMEIMGNNPFEFVMDHSTKDLERFNVFVHRTFNANDAKFFISSLKNIYQNHNGLEGVFTKYQTEDSMQLAIHELKKIFFSVPHQPRTQKHISDSAKGSAAKRINMMLRWLVRQDDCGVDFGIWKHISPSKLSCPLDVHSGRYAREFGLLTRKQNDAKALAELDAHLRLFDSNDPSKYDFALFGLGVFGL